LDYLEAVFRAESPKLNKLNFSPHTCPIGLKMNCLKHFRCNLHQVWVQGSVYR